MALRDITALELSRRKEYNIGKLKQNTYNKMLSGYIPLDEIKIINQLYPTGAQIFIENVMNPNTIDKSTIIKWQTGVGKSNAAIMIGNRFIQLFRQLPMAPELQPSVIIISFSKETIQKELLTTPEFGFISQEEMHEKYRLAQMDDPKHLSSFIGTIRRRITDRSRGGYYKFYGYKEFAMLLFIPTTKGIDANFDILSLLHPEKDFNVELEKATQAGLIRINHELLKICENSVIICDEIHNTYNVSKPNNYGLAIQYVMDIIPKERRPRIIIMSATLLTGSASEIVDVINLAVPPEERGGKKIMRQDLFTQTTVYANEDDNTEDKFVVSQLKPGALEQIDKFLRGKVSFLLDLNKELYPERIFMGNTVPNIPYIKLVECPMSPAHYLGFTSAKEMSSNKSLNAGFQTSMHVLYDMVFPGNVFTSEDIAKLETHDITSPHNMSFKVMRESGNVFYSGSWLKLDNLKLFSEKFYTCLNNIITAMREGRRPKLLIYHNRVRVNGIFIWREILKENGFIEEFAQALDTTLCINCGLPRSDKNACKDYVPARFTIAYSEIKNQLMKHVNKFNSPDNLYGQKMMAILGSRVIKEAIDFKAVTDMHILSLADDYPTLIQTIGRAVRKNSHIDLPPEKRKALIYIYVTTAPAGQNFISPELQKYIDKGREYLVIQDVERVINKNAIDNYMNYPSIHEVVGDTPTLEALPYTIDVKKVAPQDLLTNTFSAFFSDKEINAITLCCKQLFINRPVWRLEDLREEVKKNVVGYYDLSICSDENFAVAIDSLMTPIDNKILINIDDFYIYTNMSDMGKPQIDIESYIRPPTILKNTKISLSNYLREIGPAARINNDVQKLNQRYLAKDSFMPLEFCLVEFNSTLHYYLLEQYSSSNTIPITIDDDKMRGLYRKFRCLLKNGYVERDYININGKHLIKEPDERTENNIVIAFTAEDGKIRLRDPLSKLKITNDERTLARGSVCETKHRNILEQYIRQLRLYHKKHGGAETSFSDLQISSAVANDHDLEDILTEDEFILAARATNNTVSRFPSTSELCFLLKKELLNLEMEARMHPNGASRWMYLFNDKQPI